MPIERDAGARNSAPRGGAENSLLFSLDSLLQMATDERGKSGRATAAIEGSGLIDIRTLGAMAAKDTRRPPMSPTATVPVFGGAGLVGLGTLVTTPGSTPTVVVGSQRSEGPLLAMIGLLVLVVLALGAYIVLDAPEPVVITTPAAATLAPSMAEQRDAAAAAIARDVTAELDRGRVDEPAPAEAPAVVASPAKAGEPRSTARKSERKAVVPRVEPAKKNDDVPIECVLDPKLARCSGGKAAQSEPVRTSDANLPLSLSQSDIRTGVGPLKEAAKSCGAKHGAKPGEKVRVKLSIAGATGKVASAAAEPPHQGTSLGNCVAATLKKASFSKFRKPVVGVVYAITM